MENTSPLIFDNKLKVYFIAQQAKATGPVTAQGVAELVQKGEITPLHFVWADGEKDWKRISERKEFSSLLPTKPSQKTIEKIQSALDQIKEKKKRAASSSKPDRTRSTSDRTKFAEPRQDQEAPTPPLIEPRQLYLYYQSSQYGPFSHDELLQILESHRVGKNAYMWKPGWSTWKRLREVPEYKAYYKDEVELETRTEVRKQKEKDEKRGAPRRPFVARIFISNNEEVVLAVCRDISIGGMQVLTDRVPGAVGSVVKLNVSPGDPGKVKGFTAEGEIVRILEDGRGFSFRFTKLSDAAHSEIESYLETEAV